MRYKSDRPGGDQERESEKVDQHEGYIDPDLFFDPLPQPYRMISKLFDLEILDKMWLEVLRRHPEIQLDSDGNQLVKRRNQNISTVCFPSHAIEHQIIPTSISGARDCVYVCNSVGNFFVLDHSGRVLSTLSLNKVRKETEFEIIRSLNVSYGSQSLERVVILSFVLSNEYAEADSTEKEKPKLLPRSSVSLSADTDIPMNLYKANIAVVDVDDSQAPKVNSKVSFTISIDCNRAEANELVVSLSDDGEMLVVVKDWQVLFYPLHDDVSSLMKVDKPEKPRGMGNIIEDVEVTDFNDIVSCALVGPFATASIRELIEQSMRYKEEITSPDNQNHAVATNVANSAAVSSSVKGKGNQKSNSIISSASTAVLPTTVARAKVTMPKLGKIVTFPLANTSTVRGGLYSESKSDTMSRWGAEQDRARISNTGLALIWEDNPEFLLLSFAQTAVAKKAGKAVGAVGAGGADAGKQKSATPGTASDKDTLVIPFLQSRWGLSSSVSAVAVDPVTGLLALGLRDGCVAVWDLRGLVMCGGDFARHEAAVLSMAFTHGRQLRLVSGAMDGTISVLQIEASLDLGGGRGGGSAGGGGSSLDPDSADAAMKAVIVDYRSDTSLPILRVVAMQSCGFVVALTADGDSLAYDIDEGQLLGRLQPRATMPGDPPEWKPVCRANIFHLNAVNAATSAATLPPIADTKQYTKRLSKSESDTSGASVTSKQPLAEIPSTYLSEYPVTWKEKKRSLGFHTTAQEAISSLGLLAAALQTATTSAFVGLYRKAETRVLSAQANAWSPVLIVIFPLSHMFATMCPGVAALSHQLERDKVRGHDSLHVAQHSTVLPPWVLYKSLTPDQRLDPGLTLAHAEKLGRYLNNPGVSFSSTTRSLEFKLTRKTSSKTLSQKKSSATNLREKFRRSSSGLTEKKLRALDSSFGALPTCPADDPEVQGCVSLRQRVWRSSRDPTEVLKRAYERSDNDRGDPVNRNRKILSRLQNLSSLI